MYINAILLALCAFLLLLFALICAKRYTVQNQYMSDFDKVYGALATGDLILFRHESIDYLYEMIDSYTHVGMVVVPKDNSSKSIIETHKLGDTHHFTGYDAQGVNMYDLRTRVATYDGWVYVVHINRDLVTDSSGDMIINRLHEYQQIPFFEGYRDFFKHYCISKRVFHVEKPHHDGMFCAEFICHLLKDSGLLSRSHECECMTPGLHMKLQANGTPDLIYPEPPILVKSPPRPSMSPEIETASIN